MGEKVVERKTSPMPLTSMISDVVGALNGTDFEKQDVIVVFTTRNLLRKIPELDGSLLLEFGYIPQ